jgi:hypothetical protein
LIIGFVLGLVGSLLTFLVSNYVNRRQHLFDFKKGLLAEMRGFLGMFAMQTYIVKRNLNELDLATFKWIHSLISKADQDFLSPQGKEAVKILRGIPEDQFNDAYSFQSAREKSNKVSPSVKKRSFPFLEANHARVSLLDSKTQLLISKILVKNEMINQAVEDYRFYRGLTFDMNQTDKNRDRIEENIRSLYRVIADRFLIDWISNLIDELTRDLQQDKYADKVRYLSKQLMARAKIGGKHE